MINGTNVQSIVNKKVSGSGSRFMMHSSFPSAGSEGTLELFHTTSGQRWVLPGQLARQYRATHRRTHSHSISRDNSESPLILHVFARDSGEDPHKHRENMQTPYWKDSAGILTRDLSLRGDS